MLKKTIRALNPGIIGGITLKTPFLQ